MINRTLRCLALLLTFLAIAAPGQAYRREFRVLLNGERKAGSEVCFYRGENRPDPFALYFANADVRCLPADDVLDFPAGLFHVFARHRDGYASAYRDYFSNVRDAPDEGYEALDIPLEPAGYADVGAVGRTLREGQSLGIWLAATRTTQGMFLPLVPGEQRIAVPADNPFVPLMIERGSLVRVGTPLHVAAGATVVIPAFVLSRDVVAFTRIDRETSLDAVESAPPTIQLIGAEFTRAPLFPIFTGGAAHNSLVFFKDVPTGAATLRVGGPVWLPVDQDVDVLPGNATLVRPPLLLTPVGAVTLQWPTEGNAIGNCPVPDSDRPKMRATLARCVKPSGATEQEVCGNVATSSVDYASGTMLLQQRDSGGYRITVQRPYGGAIVLPVQLTAGAEVVLNVPIEAFTFFGVVTLNGHPLPDAKLLFESGEARTDDLGRYTATLAGNPLANIITVVACESGQRLLYTPRSAPLPNTTFDIALQMQPLQVVVRDETGKPAPGATVRFSSIKDAAVNEAYYASLPLVTGTDGTVAFPDVPTDNPVMVCATLPLHAMQCSKLLDAAALATGKVVIQFDAAGFRGHITGHDGTGFLYWVTPGGQTLETVTVGPKGEFGFRNSPGTLDHLVYVSDRRPLTVLPLPANGQSTADLQLALPAGPMAAFTVRVANPAQRPRFVGLWVGNDYVPIQALAIHQEFRGQDVQVSGAHPLLIRDIIMGAPLSVAAAPSPEPEPAEFVDLYTLPAYAHVQRFRVTGSIVTIDP